MSQMNQPGGRPWRRLIDWFAFAFLMIVASLDLFSAIYAIPRFREIYHDLLGNKPLPAMTSIVLQGRYLLGILAVGYLGGGIVVFRVVSRQIASCYILLMSLGAVIQAGFTILSLFAPLIGDIQGLSRT